MGNYADWMYMLCRTGTEESRHRGITMLLVDAHQPGVDVRPIRNIAGGLEFCEVFFDDVRTPADLVVGEVNGGWNVAMDTLGMERTGAMSPYMATFEAEMTRLLDEVKRRRSGALPVLRQRLAQAWSGLQVLQYMNQRLLAAELHGGDAGAVGAVLKIYWSRWHRSFGELMLEVFGPTRWSWATTPNPTGTSTRSSTRAPRRSTEAPTRSSTTSSASASSVSPADPLRLHVLAAHAPQTTVRALEPPVVVAGLPQKRLADAWMRQHEEAAVPERVDRHVGAELGLDHVAERHRAPFTGVGVRRPLSSASSSRPIMPVFTALGHRHVTCTPRCA